MTLCLIYGLQQTIADISFNFYFHRMQKLIDNNFRRQLWLTLAFAMPLIGSNLAQSSKHVVDAVMLGRYGVDELAAGVLGGTIFLITFVVGSGFAMASIPLAAEARGAGLTWKVRRTLRMTFWLSTVYFLLLLIPLHYVEPFLLLVGQELVIAQLTGEYMTIALWGVFPAIIVMNLKSFFMALGKPNVILWSTVIGAAINVPANYAFIFGNWGAPELGIKGAAYATIFAHSFTMIAMFIYLFINRTCRSYSLLSRLWRPEWKILVNVFRLGWPVSATLTTEIGLFAVCSIMMGWIGTASLAAHGIVLESAALVFMIYLGFANAVTTQVGFAVGSQDQNGVVLAANAALFLTIVVVIVVVIVFVLLPETLVQVFLRDSEESAEVLRIGVNLVYMAAAFQLADALQVVALGLLRGLRDTKVPMIIAAVSYSIIGLPAGYYFGFIVGLEGIGVWIGFIAGLGSSAILLLTRFRRKLRSMSFTILRRNLVNAHETSDG